MDNKHNDGGNDHAYDQGDLDHGKPEFCLPESLDSNKVDEDEDSQERYLYQPFPRRQVNIVRPEKLYEILGNCGKFSHTDKDEHDPVRPLREVSPAFAHIFRNKVDKRVLAWIIIHKFADSAHQDEHYQPHHNIHEDDRRAGERYRFAGTEEKPGTDGAILSTPCCVSALLHTKTSSDASSL